MLNNFLKYIIFISSFLIIGKSNAQEEDLLSLLGEDDEPEAFVLASFKGTRLINFHTVEVPGKRSLDFRINHHFGDINSGAHNFFGLDGGASIRLGLDYSFDGRFNFGVGRSSYEKVYDGFIKYKLLRQTLSNKIPVTITLFSGIYYTTMDDPLEGTGALFYQYKSSRISYATQIIIARKFSKKFTLQVSPTWIHYNIVEYLEDSNELYCVGFAGRWKATNRLAITFEYGLAINDYSVNKYFPHLGIGFDLETGGHVFQMYFTNSMGMIAPQFFGRNIYSWKDFAVKFGFNISRMFTIGKKKEKESE